jgi:hypothetical protein
VATDAAAACAGAAAGLGLVVGSPLDTMTAPIRHVRVVNFSSPRLCKAAVDSEAAAADEGAQELDGAAIAVAVGLGADEASGLDTMTAPIRHVRVATFPACCC